MKWDKELIALVLEFWLSLAIILGGGFMIYHNTGTEVAVSSITAVIMFWFNRRQNEKQAEALKEALNSQKDKPPTEG